MTPTPASWEKTKTTSKQLGSSFNEHATTQNTSESLWRLLPATTPSAASKLVGVYAQWCKIYLDLRCVLLYACTCVSVCVCARVLILLYLCCMRLVCACVCARVCACSRVGGVLPATLGIPNADPGDEDTDDDDSES